MCNNYLPLWTDPYTDHCPMPSCKMEPCPNGLARNKNGCIICECAGRVTIFIHNPFCVRSGHSSTDTSLYFLYSRSWCWKPRSCSLQFSCCGSRPHLPSRLNPSFASNQVGDEKIHQSRYNCNQLLSLLIRTAMF